MNFDPHGLSTKEKIGQLFFIGIPGPEFDADTAALIQEIKPGGVCLFARNIKEAGQTRSLLDSIRGASAIEPFLSLDQEGGRVDRLRRIFTPMPSASQLRTASDARELGNIIGEAISLLGFNMNFAPVVDVIDESRRHLLNGLQTRGLGNSKTDVAEMAVGMLNGFREHGISGCLKHFPGLGDTRVDSHEELPRVDLDMDALWDVDLFPYRELIGRDDVCVMVAHAAYPNTGLQDARPDGKLVPSSMNGRIVISLLRHELGFSGVAVTDDMEMGAIVKNFGIGEASKLAVEAGEDMLAICASGDAIREAFRSIEDAVDSGELEERRLDESVARIAALKSRLKPPPNPDPDRLRVLDERIKNLNQHLN